MRVLITAGATHEKIDAVRYISNYSTGKMGYALAQVAINFGAKVTLIAGPNNLQVPTGVDKFISVISAAEMYEATISNYDNCDIAIMSAAVADFSPQNIINNKIKKEDLGDEFSLKLKKNKDILKELGEKKTAQILIGFALETSNEIQNATQKLVSKNCDMIVVNTAGKKNSGFGGDNNTISIIQKKSTQIKNFPSMSKIKCAEEIFLEIANLFL